MIAGERVPPHHTAYLSEDAGAVLTVEAADDSYDEEVDFLFLSGSPLQEPVAAQGSMVMNSYDEINDAYGDYQVGRMGRPWSETLSDEEWREHIREFPCVYKTDEYDV